MTYASHVKARYTPIHFYRKQLWLKNVPAKVVTVANEFTGIITKINNAIRNDKNMRIALSTVLAIQKQRIFSQGFDGRGVKIGTYSTKPTSISRKNQARDTGKTFFKGGYAEYKRAIGKNPGYVNLRNTDQMMMDYTLMGGSGEYAFGFHNSENLRKMKNLERKYVKDIADTSKYELDTLADILTDQLIKSL